MSSTPSARQAFLHLKFTSQRPPPQYGHQLPFAHLVDPSIHDLPDSLKTDVQREGIKRYLVQNFAEGSFVWEVVKNLAGERYVYLRFECLIASRCPTSTN